MSPVQSRPWPLTIQMLEVSIPRRSATRATTASLARPFSGGAFTFTLSESPSQPTTPARPSGSSVPCDHKPRHAKRSCTTTSDRASWPPLGMAGFTAFPIAIMKPITWSLGRLMISATFIWSKPIIGQES